MFRRRWPPFGDAKLLGPYKHLVVLQSSRKETLERDGSVPGEVAGVITSKPHFCLIWAPCNTGRVGGIVPSFL